MKKSRKIGDLHVIQVYEELKKYLENGTPIDETTVHGATAKFILDKIPSVHTIKNKFQYKQPDKHPDLIISSGEGITSLVNLFKIKNRGKIQPKNLGAKSFLEKYFDSRELQNKFNNYFAIEYIKYLDEIIKIGNLECIIGTIKDKKREIKTKYPSFSEEIEQCRENFLYSLREYCFKLLAEEYNSGAEGIRHAFHDLFMKDSINVITRYDSYNELLSVEEFNPQIGNVSDFKIIKKTKYSIGVSTSDITLLIRFKFESSPVSSTKLATSFENLPEVHTVVQKNKESIELFKEELVDHIDINVSKKDQNAIGKCNEAIIYYQIIKFESSIRQVDTSSFINMFIEYSLLVPSDIIEKLIAVSEVAVIGLLKYLTKKHKEFIIESIELVPDNYIKNRLDTSDLMLVLKVNNKYISEPISLKATEKRTGKVTSKNPGIGTILGPNYFDLNSLNPIVAESKARYHNSELAHKEVLEIVSDQLGEELIIADQSNLIKGIKALLGEALLLIVFYGIKDYYVLEHGSVQTNVVVKKNYPTRIQNTLYWNNQKEEISLRVKFSGNQSKGWTSLKLACDYKYSKKK